MVYDDKMYIVGGWDGHDHYFENAADYDLQENAWLHTVFDTTGTERIECVLLCVKCTFFRHTECSRTKNIDFALFFFYLFNFRCVENALPGKRRRPTAVVVSGGSVSHPYMLVYGGFYTESAT